MKKIKDYLIEFFKKKENIVLVSLIAIMIILIIIPIKAIWYTKLILWIISAILIIGAYKFIQRYKRKKEIYEISESQSSNKKMMEKINSKMNNVDYKNELIYGIIFIALAIMIFVYTIVN